ncbi:uncharacterized protein LOC144708010 [Wolffia australiana]
MAEEASDDRQRDWEVVATSGGSILAEEDFSVFPPSNHEGLLLEETSIHASEMKITPISSNSCYNSSVSGSKNGGVTRWAAGIRRNLVEYLRGALDSRIVRFKLSRLGVGEAPGVWSVGAVLGLAAMLLYSRHRHRREKIRLLLLIKDKDQTITWLSQHIAQMNELMASRLVVPVARNA